MGETLQIHNRSPERARIVRAAELVRQGHVIAIPTDTVYGLAANPFDPSAVQRIFVIKNRPESRPLLLLVDSLEMAADLSAAPPPDFYRLAERFWPGPLTIVVEASPKLPPPVTAHTGRIGLRLPSAPIPVAL
ncbi:MAG: L-threonylcarbamoyladenylate synthase, partial [Acidobacteria bacterium]|nr:L-threonylcarbamoyladenylate synthase [Acidobacteriota bacterium]